MNVIIKRNYFEEQTEGMLEIYNDKECIYHCKVLERPWKNNQRNISCIPEGKYEIKKEIQPKRGKVLRIKNVPDRDGILMHKGNYVSHSKGCLLPGLELEHDINNDGLKDVTQSTVAMNEIYDTLTDEKNYLIIKS